MEKLDGVEQIILAPKWRWKSPGASFLKPDFIWVPSIGVGGIKFYQGNAFPEWQNSLLVGSLKYQYLSVSS